MTMKILALDTSGVDCAVCIYDAGTKAVLAEVTENIGKGHAERLMALVEQVLQSAECTLKDIGRVGVTVGPGSFTGIRVGVAAARGFAVALGVDAIGVTTLETVGRAYHKANPGKAFAVAFDAKRDEVYLQIFGENGAPASVEQLLSLDEARVLLDGFEGGIIGTGAAVLLGQIVSDDKDHFPIAIVAEITADKPAGGENPKPLYLRGPDARPQSGFALERKA
jgi:tRNA threonylcarbamoyladenosine biosynthesis protein TsaB